MGSWNGIAMLAPLAPLLGQAGAWLIAALWLFRVVLAHRGLPTVPDLLEARYDQEPAGEPSLAVIVPACNEQPSIRACLQSLVDQDYRNLQVIAVDDRSTDRTGAMIDELAAQHPDRLLGLHIVDLPKQWLGKTHAMAVAARASDSDWFLFTDGDVLFRNDSLRRALAYAVATDADHLVLAPTTIIRRWDEAALLAFFQIFGLWVVRPWRVADPRSRDAIGIGAFNLVRRSAYQRIGGFESLRMAVVEDLGLGSRVKAAGLRQRMAFGRGLVQVHWAAGADGLIRTLTKNMFAAFNFQPARLFLACLWLAAFGVAPFVCVWRPRLWLPGLLAIAAMAYGYYLLKRRSGLPVAHVVLAPLAATALIYALQRSMWSTLRQGGIFWRGTFYSLRELRANQPGRPF
jgi:glycosyltransferase involved in cell wall biosynthesis